METERQTKRDTERKTDIEEERERKKIDRSERNRFVVKIVKEENRETGRLHKERENTEGDKDT